MLLDTKQLVQWENPDLAVNQWVVLPGVCINMHARMTFAALPRKKADSWV